MGGISPSPFHSLFELSETEIRDVLARALRALEHGKQLILVSHSPPFNTKVDITHVQIHAGSQALKDFIKAEKPSLALCGYIHEARGIDTLSGSLIINPGPARRGAYAIVNIDGGISAKLGILE